MSGTPFPVIGPDLRSALVAAVRRRVPESEVEDIVQATLADALGSPHAPEEPGAYRRWIFGIAKHKVVDYHRRAGRETFEVPDVPGRSAPHVEADLLRWAEKNIPPGEENQATLDWMLREGEGEKLESIAETEDVPAPRVRQRVSRLRRHLKAHWQKEVALLVALGVIATLLALALRPKPNEPIANEGIERAEELRRIGIAKCVAAEWVECVDKLDAAKQLDPAGDSRPEVKRAREDAKKALTPLNITPPPLPTTVDPPASPTSSAPKRGNSKTPAPFSTEAPLPSKVIPSKDSASTFGSPTDEMPNDGLKSTPVQSKKVAKPQAKPMSNAGTDFGSLGGSGLGGSSFGGTSKPQEGPKK
jgi:DNA-directed RNA polymerase specialized sigma24 family protein